MRVQGREVHEGRKHIIRRTDRLPTAPPSKKETQHETCTNEIFYEKRRKERKEENRQQNEGDTT